MRGGRLSAEDRELWERVRASATPLHPAPALPTSLAPMPPFSSSQVPRKRIVRGTGRPDFLYSQSAYTIAASPLFISLAPRA